MAEVYDYRLIIEHNADTVDVVTDETGDSYKAVIEATNAKLDIEVAEIGDDYKVVIEMGRFVNIAGTDNYEVLRNLPQINSVTLLGNKTTEDLHIPVDIPLTAQEVLDLLNL